MMIQHPRLLDPMTTLDRVQDWLQGFFVVRPLCSEVRPRTDDDRRRFRHEQLTEVQPGEYRCACCGAYGTRAALPFAVRVIHADQ